MHESGQDCDELVRLLGEVEIPYRVWLRDAMSGVGPDGRPESLFRIALFGAGGRGRILRRTLEGFRIGLVVCFADSDSTKWGTRFDGLPVLSPDRLAAEGVDRILISSQFEFEILRTLERLGAAEIARRNLVEFVRRDRPRSALGPAELARWRARIGEVAASLEVHKSPDVGEAVYRKLERALAGVGWAGWKDRVVLELGGGRLYYGGRFFLAQGARLYVGSDIAIADPRSSIETMSASDADPVPTLGRRVLFIEADATRGSFASGTADVILSYGLFEHVLDPARAIRELHRILRPGGFCAHYVDAADHDAYTPDFAADPFVPPELDFLRDGATPPSGQYNFWRISDFAASFKTAGFEGVRLSDEVRIPIPAGLERRLAPSYRKYNPEDLAVVHFCLAARR